ncbi:hypothetical protein JCM12296A_46810 [Desulfosarcina cetonica]
MAFRYSSNFNIVGGYNNAIDVLRLARSFNCVSDEWLSVHILKVFFYNSLGLSSSRNYRQGLDTVLIKIHVVVLHAITAL